jgi:hypothetical protein
MWGVSRRYHDLYLYIWRLGGRLAMGRLNVKLCGQHILSNLGDDHALTQFLKAKLFKLR